MSVWTCYNNLNSTLLNQQAIVSTICINFMRSTCIRLLWMISNFAGVLTWSEVQIWHLLSPKNCRDLIAWDGNLHTVSLTVLLPIKNLQKKKANVICRSTTFHLRLLKGKRSALRVVEERSLWAYKVYFTHYTDCTDFELQFANHNLLISNGCYLCVKSLDP